MNGNTEYRVIGCIDTQKGQTADLHFIFYFIFPNNFLMIEGGAVLCWQAVVDFLEVMAPFKPSKYEFLIHLLSETLYIQHVMYVEFLPVDKFVIFACSADTLSHLQTI